MTTTRLRTPIVATSFTLFHLACAAVFFIDLSPRAPWLFAVSYVVRMLAVTMGFHRLFSHRSFTVSRPVQFLIGLVATTSFQRGPLWWAASHRAHHRFADAPGDPHSPRDGFWHAQIGWVLKHRAVNLDDVKDLARLPEIVWLERFYALPPLVLAMALTLAFGTEGLVVGFVLPTVVLWHVAGLVNSLAHLRGTQPWDTGDGSRNAAWLALPTLGDGWHNNHHRFPGAASAGGAWWQLDLTWAAIRALEIVGVARAVRRPPAAGVATINPDP